MVRLLARKTPWTSYLSLYLTPTGRYLVNFSYRSLWPVLLCFGHKFRITSVPMNSSKSLEQGHHECNERQEQRGPGQGIGYECRHAGRCRARDEVRLRQHERLVRK